MPKRGHTPNRFTVNGEIALIHLAGKVAEARDLVTVIDADALPLALAFRWSPVWNPRPGKFYVHAKAKGPDGRDTTIYLHRVVTGAPKGKEVDHINHDTLDNRRENLKVGSHTDNMRNGKKALAAHCPHGHPYDDENTYRDKRGRRCKTCNRDRQRRLLAAESPAQRQKRLEQRRGYRNLTKDRPRPTRT